MKAIARLFADVGDSYVELIATGISSYHLYTHFLCQLFSSIIFTVLSRNHHIFVVFLDFNAEIFIVLHQHPASDESMMIVNSLLEVASHPEYDIASMTFNFWHSLQVILTKR